MGPEEIKVTALTSGLRDPSSRFRITQYIEPLSLSRIKVKEFCPFISKYALPNTGFFFLDKLFKVPFFLIKAFSRVPGILNSKITDITWMNRELIAGRHTFERFIDGVRVFDVDDAIWAGGSHVEKSVINIIKNVDVVLAGNSYIAEWCKKFCPEVYVVPTSIDTHKFAPINKSETGDEFVIGWTGTRHTIKYLFDIESALQRFLSLHHDAVLLIVSDACPKREFLQGSKIRWVKWSPDIEASIINEMNVGIMPLPDDEWTKGKCSFKMLQYMACGIPTVVSPVGMNLEVLSLDKIGLGATTDEEWFDSLSILYNDRQLCAELGISGRRVILNKFSIDVISHQIEMIFFDIKKRIYKSNSLLRKKRMRTRSFPNV